MWKNFFAEHWGRFVAVSVVLLLLGAVELGLVSLHSSNNSSTSQTRVSKSEVTSGRQLAASPCDFEWAVDTQTSWSWPLWLWLYQHHSATSTTTVAWTSSCQQSGTATLTIDLEVTCRGLRGVSGCRSDVRSIIADKIAAIQAGITEG